MDPFALRSPESYLSLKEEGMDEIVIDKSRFIAIARPVESVEMAEAFIQSLREEYADATHVCWAYIIGPGGIQMKASDDGEPSGTAGVPILEVLKKEGLTDCCAAVVRYFGGVKLGAGGLIRAYGKGAKIGVEAAGIASWSKHYPLAVTVEYPLSGSLTYHIEQEKWKLQGQDFTDKVTYHLDVPLSELEKVVGAIENLSKGQAEIEQGELHYAASQTREA